MEVNIDIDFSLCTGLQLDFSLNLSKQKTVFYGASKANLARIKSMGKTRALIRQAIAQGHPESRALRTAIQPMILEADRLLNTETHEQDLESESWALRQPLSSDQRALSQEFRRLWGPYVHRPTPLSQEPDSQALGQHYSRLLACVAATGDGAALAGANAHMQRLCHQRALHIHDHVEPPRIEAACYSLYHALMFGATEFRATVQRQRHSQCSTMLTGMLDLIGPDEVPDDGDRGVSGARARLRAWRSGLELENHTGGAQVIIHYLLTSNFDRTEESRDQGHMSRLRYVLEN